MRLIFLQNLRCKLSIPYMSNTESNCNRDKPVLQTLHWSGYNHDNCVPSRTFSSSCQVIWVHDTCPSTAKLWYQPCSKLIYSAQTRLNQTLTVNYHDVESTWPKTLQKNRLLVRSSISWVRFEPVRYKQCYGICMRWCTILPHWAGGHFIICCDTAADDPCWFSWYMNVAYQWQPGNQPITSMNSSSLWPSCLPFFSNMHLL